MRLSPSLFIDRHRAGERGVTLLLLNMVLSLWVKRAQRMALNADSSCFLSIPHIQPGIMYPVTFHAWNGRISTPSTRLSPNQCILMILCNLHANCWIGRASLHPSRFWVTCQGSGFSLRWLPKSLSAPLVRSGTVGDSTAALLQSCANRRYIGPLQPI